MFDIVLACLGIASGTVTKRDTVDRPYAYQSGEYNHLFIVIIPVCVLPNNFTYCK